MKTINESQLRKVISGIIQQEMQLNERYGNLKPVFDLLNIKDSRSLNDAADSSGVTFSEWANKLLQGKYMGFATPMGMIVLVGKTNLITCEIKPVTSRMHKNNIKFNDIFDSVSTATIVSK